MAATSANPPSWLSQARRPVPALTVACASSTLPLGHQHVHANRWPECRKGFKRKSALEAHQWVHHAGKTPRWQQPAAGFQSPSLIWEARIPWFIYSTVLSLENKRQGLCVCGVRTGNGHLRKTKLCVRVEVKGRDGPLEGGWNLNSFSEVPAPTSKSYLGFLHSKHFTWLFLLDRSLPSSILVGLSPRL